jgi:TonB family protein
MVEVGATARIAGGVIAGNRVSFVEPMYPESAKERHESGSVILRAVIGRDGHVHSLRPTNAADADFVIAAIAAVRQWTYRPYLLNGEPTEVDTTITVNFALNQY